MAISLSSAPISGGYNKLRVRELRFSNCTSSRSLLSANPNRRRKLRNSAIRADYSNASRGGGGGGADFVTGFLLGATICGTLAYIFAPQIRRSVLNEDEYGFQKARRPIYYDDEGLEKTRQTLNAKLSQLNAAIDNVSTRLRGGNNMTPMPVESDSEVEATT